MQVTVIWCEWDILINNDIFISKDIARAHVITALKSAGIDETCKELEEAGLVGFRNIDVTCN